MKVTLRLIGLFGIVIFGTAFFWLMYGVPGGVENIATDFIKEQIEKEVGEKIESLSLAAQDTKLGQITQKIIKGREAEIVKLKEQLRAKSYERATDVIAEMRDLSCECRKKYAQHYKQEMEIQLGSLQLANDALLDFMKFKYMEVVAKLTQDLQIFTGTNLAVFVVLLLLSFVKPQAIVHLFFPAILLVISTVVCSYFYLFEQDWFFTIIYSNYIGFGYLTYVMGLFAVLSDISFNRAQVTTEIINGCLELVGSVESVSPC